MATPKFLAGQNTLQRHMYRRGTIYHCDNDFVENLAAPLPLARQHRSAAPTMLARKGTKLEKLYLFHTILDEDDLYMKIVALDDI